MERGIEGLGGDSVIRSCVKSRFFGAWRPSNSAGSDW